VALLMEAVYESLEDLRERAKAEVAKVVLGQDRAVELMLVAALARGHILLEGPPGSAKTLLGRAVAHMLGASFKRIQFTPDTTPAELTGVSVMKGGEPVFHPGAVFANVLLADEINRTPPRSQAALLEAMQERQVTVDGKAHRLPDPFLVIATQNPFEHEGVFTLPEAQLDRFLFKLELDYPDAEFELGMLNLPHNGIAPDMLGEVKPLLGVVGLDRARDELNSTTVSDAVGRYVVTLARRTRDVPGVELGVSSRGIMHLMSAAKANARLCGRDHVSIADVREMAPFVLRHRLIMADSSTTPDKALQQVLDSIPAPVPSAVADEVVVQTPATPQAPAAPAPASARGLDAESLLLTDAPPLTDSGFSTD
jgi:MoxR-like ATPase